jgi:hypothetical protein
MPPATGTFGPFREQIDFFTCSSSHLGSTITEDFWSLAGHLRANGVEREANERLDISGSPQRVSRSAIGIDSRFLLRRRNPLGVSGSEAAG